MILFDGVRIPVDKGFAKKTQKTNLAGYLNARLAF